PFSLLSRRHSILVDQPSRSRDMNNTRRSSGSRWRSLHNRLAIFATAVAGGIALTATVLDAHDFWIVPDAFAIAPGGTIAALGQTGVRFPTSESAVATNRVV